MASTIVLGIFSNGFYSYTFMDKDKMMSEKRKFLQELLQHILLILEYRAGEKIEYEKVMQDLFQALAMRYDFTLPETV